MGKDKVGSDVRVYHVGIQRGYSDQKGGFGIWSLSAFS